MVAVVLVVIGVVMAGGLLWLGVAGTAGVAATGLARSDHGNLLRWVSPL
jgi:hypothetical protein